MTLTVLDASAILAYVQQEPGWELVEAIDQPGISAVNFCEAVSKLADWSAEPNFVSIGLRGIEPEILPFDELQAELAGQLRTTTRHLGLSLGDRACLALGLSLNAPVVTADRAWARLDLGLDIRFIR